MEQNQQIESTFRVKNVESSSVNNDSFDSANTTSNRKSPEEDDVIENVHDEADMVQEDKESPSQKFVKFEEYSNKTGRTLYYADCSAVEAAHSLLHQLEEAHGPKTVHAHGSDQHLKRFTRSIVFFSSKNFGPDSKEEEEEMITQEQVDEINNLLQNEMMDTEEPVDASQYFVPIPEKRVARAAESSQH